MEKIKPNLQRAVQAAQMEKVRKEQEGTANLIGKPKPDSILIAKDRLLGLRYRKDGKYVPFDEILRPAIKTLLALYEEVKKKQTVDVAKLDDELVTALLMASFGIVIEKIYDKDAMVQGLLFTIQDLISNLEAWSKSRTGGWWRAKAILVTIRKKIQQV